MVMVHATCVAHGTNDIMIIFLGCHGVTATTNCRNFKRLFLNIMFFQALLIIFLPNQVQLASCFPQIWSNISTKQHSEVQEDQQKVTVWSEIPQSLPKEHDVLHFGNSTSKFAETLVPFCRVST